MSNFSSGHQEGQVSRRECQGWMTAAANKMFAFYTNLLSVEAKYVWNKIIEEQMEGDPCVDLQGVSQKDPRGCHISCLTIA